jgi:LytR cell envelope-related transcriptional attenuator
MSNSTRQGGYDERLVVPLEASRRGAHRARTNPLVAALPLLVVVIVVAAVIGVAYALFVKPSGDTSANEPLTSTTPPAATSAPATAQPSVTSSKSSSSSSSSSASASTSTSSAPAAVDTSAAFTVANGSGKTGLAGRVTSALKHAGFSGASVDTNSWRGTPVSETTVFYAKDSQKATAEAIASALGNGHARKSASDANGGIVVVAFDEAAK